MAREVAAGKSQRNLTHFRRQNLLGDFVEKGRKCAPNYSSQYNSAIKKDPGVFKRSKGMCADFLDNSGSNLYISSPFGRR